MKTSIFLYFSALLILLQSIACKNNEDGNETTLLRGINIIDAKSGLSKDQDVLIINEKITKIGSRLDVSASAKVIDGSGKYVIPGLWDAHVHFVYIEELAEHMFDLFLYYGITSVRDTGGKIELVKEWREKSRHNPDSSPRVMIAGPLIDGEPNVYDGSTPSRPELSVGNNSLSDIAKLVDRLDSTGVDLLKAYEMLTPEQFALVARLAKEKGLPLTGHVPLSMDVISASDLGLNSMEHLRNVELSCALNADELLAQRRKMLELGSDDQGGILRSRIHQAQRIAAIENQDATRTTEVLEALAKNGTIQVPTLALSTSSSRRPFQRQEWLNTFTLLPDTIRGRWNSAVKRMSQNQPGDNNILYTNWALEMVGKMHAAGIKIMAGTDCPIFLLTPGKSLHEELRMLVEAGLTPLEAIESATLIPAQYFGLENQLGLIKPGMYADLLLLNSNPLEDIANTEDIFMVMKNGKLYNRESLSERLTVNRLEEM